MDHEDADRDDTDEPDHDSEEVSAEASPEEEPPPPRVSRNVVWGATIGGSLIQADQINGDVHLGEPAGPPTELESTAPRRPSLFVGRDRELEATLNTSDPVCAVVGMGGTGKTTLALEAAYRLREQRDHRGGLLFLDCQGYTRDFPMGLAQVTSCLLSALGVRDAPQADVAATQRLQQRYEEFAAAGLRLLLVLDNVGTRFDPEPLLPSSPAHRTLITSRDEQTVRDAALIRLPELSSAAAAGLLRAELERANPADQRARDSDGLHAVAELCGRLPLALRVIAPLLTRNPRRELGVVAAQLASPQRLAVLGPVRSAFELSFEALRDSAEEADREAAVLFRRLGCLPGIEFTDRGAAAVLDDAEPARARVLLDRLCAAHLLALGTRSDQVRFLDLTGEYAATLFAELPPRQGAPGRNESEHGPGHGPGRPVSRLDVLVRLAEHSAAIIEADLSTVDSSDGRQAASNAFRRLNAEYDALSAVATRAVDAAERESDSPHESSRRRLLSAARRITVALVVLCERTERGRESLAASRLLLRTATLLDDRRGELDAFLAMCRGLLSLDARSEAAHCLHEASKLTRQLDGYPAEFMRTFAELACRVGEFAASAAEYTRLLARYRKSEDVEGQLAALSGLGRVAFLRDDLAEAVRGYEAAWRLADQHGCARHAESALNELGRCRARLGDAEQAAKCHLDAKRSAELGGSPYGVALSLQHLGDLRRDEGKVAEALEHYAECEQIYRDAGEDRRADRLAERIRTMRTEPEEAGDSAGAPDPPIPVEPPPTASPPKRDPSTVARSMLDVLVLLVVLTAAQIWLAGKGTPPVPWAWWAVIVALIALTVARRYVYRFTTIRLPRWPWALDVLAYAGSLVHIVLALLSLRLELPALSAGVFLLGAAIPLYLHSRKRRR